MPQNPLPLPPPSDRVVYRYQVPESIPGDVRSVGLVELTVEEELMAAKRAGTEAVKLAYEMALQSLREVNGGPVRHEDASSDKAWHSMSPKVRQLVVGAYQQLHSTTEQETALFLQSQAASVG